MYYERTSEPLPDFAIGSPSDLRVQWYRCVLLVVVAFCTYTHVPLAPGGRLLVPSFPTVALVPLIFLAVRRDITHADVVFVLKIAFILLLSIALSPGLAFIGEKFLGMVQFVMAMIVVVLIVRLTQQLTLQNLERSLLVMWCLIVGGAILEVLGVIREASDAFREWAFRGQYTLYDADLRDFGMVGWSRPKLFSTEPSHVTKAFIAAVNAWLLVRVTWKKAGITAVATLSMLVIMGSPMLLMSALVSVLIVVWDRTASLGQRLLVTAFAISMALIGGAYFGGTAYMTAASRITAIDVESIEAGARPSSEQRRMVYPYLTMIATLDRSPLFGAGVGGKEAVAELQNLPSERAASAIGNNALAELGIFLGIVGGGAFLFVMVSQARRFGVTRMLLLMVLLVMFSQLMGGLDTFRFWGYVALLWGALAYADRLAAGDVTTSGVTAT